MKVYLNHDDLLPFSGTGGAGGRSGGGGEGEGLTGQVLRSKIL